MLGDTDITDQVAPDGQYEIPRLSNNQTLNVTFEQASTGLQGINKNISNVKVYASNGLINILGLPENEVVNLFSTNGALIKSTHQHSIRCEKGVYIIKTSQGVFKTHVN